MAKRHGYFYFRLTLGAYSKTAAGKWYDHCIFINKKVWHKGQTSGELQFVKEIYTDCDQDALVLKVEQQGGGCCHTKRPTCFYRKVELGKVGGGPVTLTKS